MAETHGEERQRRWRLVLGGNAYKGISLGEGDQAVDTALAALYGGGGQEPGQRSADLGGSAPNVARWLGDIRKYFSTPVVRIMQKDAVERLNLRQLLLEPELLGAVEPDIHLVANLIALNQVMPTGTRDTARQVVNKVVQDLMRRLAQPTRQAIVGSLNRATRNRRPRHNEIDWHRTIRANLKHYQPGHKTIIPETRVGFGRKRSALRDVILCIDQSGSMATSIVYASIFGAVIASLPSLATRMIVFDTSVADLTDNLHDPVELLFGARLGGGTDINKALAYCQGLIRRPRETILVLISDLFEGGNKDQMLRRAATLVDSGVQIIALLALNDEGAPGYDYAMASAFAALHIPAFACTPDLFPDLMAAAINRQEIERWAGSHGIVTARSAER